MSRIITLKFVISSTMVVATAWSQQIQSGQGGTSTTPSGNQGTGTNANAASGGQFNAGASSAARSAMPGQSGTASDFGPVAPQQGQFLPNGQPAIGPSAGTGQFGASGQFFPGGQVAPRTQFNGGQVSDSQVNGGQPTVTGRPTTGGQLSTGNQFVPGGAATARFNQVFGGGTLGAATTTVFGNPTPWFSSASARQQLQLSDSQYQGLYNAYAAANSRYQQAVRQLPANMLAAERVGRLQALQDLYVAEFNQVLDATVTSPQLRQQFKELSGRAQSSTAEGPPGWRRPPPLSLEQHRRLRLLADQWNQLAREMRERNSTGQSVPEREIEELNLEAQKQIESTLTPEQQSSWRKLVGEYYDFDAPASLSQTPSATGSR
jgi:hypothetical protein